MVKCRKNVMMMAMMVIEVMMKGGKKRKRSCKKQTSKESYAPSIRPTSPILGGQRRHVHAVANDGGLTRGGGKKTAQQPHPQLSQGPVETQS